MAGHLKDFMRWRERALCQCGRLAERIKALDGKMYTGAGYHYALMPDLVETRHQIVAAAEKSAAEWDNRSRPKEDL